MSVTWVQILAIKFARTLQGPSSVAAVRATD